MSAAGDRLRGRFAGLRVRVLVPELEGSIEADSRNEVAIYGAPYTIRDSKRLSRFIEADDSEGYAQILIDKAEDESGNRLFDAGDKAIIMDCLEAHIVTRVAQALIASVTVGDARGN